MSSAAQPVEIIPEHGENHSGLLRKPFAFSPGIFFTFSPESCSPSPRNVFHVPAGIAFTLPRNPQPDLQNLAFQQPARREWNCLVYGLTPPRSEFEAELVAEIGKSAPSWLIGVHIIRRI